MHAQRAAVAQDSDEREGLVVVEPDSDRDEIGKDVEMAVDPEPQGADEADIGRGDTDRILKEQFPVITGRKTAAAFKDGNIDSAIFCAGMGMGLVHDVVPVKELLDRMVKEAEEDIDAVKAMF